MAIPHIAVEKGDFAPAVLMSGDPKRARRIAEALLTDVRKVTDVRGVGRYTGLYRGKPFSVMVPGMGQPSLAVYATGLYSFYDTERIVRVGMMGDLAADASSSDVVIALGAHTGSSIIGGAVSEIHFSATASRNLLRAVAKAAGDNPQVKVGTIVSRGYFYGNPTEQTKRPAKIGTLGVEAEAADLYTTVVELDKEALAVLTVSDLLPDPSRDMTVKERESKFSKTLSIVVATAVG